MRFAHRTPARDDDVPRVWLDLYCPEHEGIPVYPTPTDLMPDPRLLTPGTRVEWECEDLSGAGEVVRVEKYLPVAWVQVLSFDQDVELVADWVDTSA